MYEVIALAGAVFAFIGSACSILSYTEYRIDKYRRRKRDMRRKKMMEKGNEPGDFSEPRL